MCVCVCKFMCSETLKSTEFLLVIRRLLVGFVRVTHTREAKTFVVSIFVD